MAARRTSRTPPPARARGGVADVAGPLRRALVAWLAILGLLVQLSAAAACTMGARASDPAMDLAAFPMCHGQAAVDGSNQGHTHDGDGHHAPGQQAPCPYCALHCHVALASPPAIVTAGAVVVLAAAEPRPARPRVGSTVRVCAAASPRGPPRA